MENANALSTAFVADIGEPACFACNSYDEKAPTYPEVSVEVAWRRSGLQRAHLRPRALGGGNEPANFVMLCASCHAAAPDWIEPAEMLSWVARRSDYRMRRYESVEGEHRAIRPDQPMPEVCRQEIVIALSENASTQGASVSDATVALALAATGRAPQPAPGVQRS